MVVWTDDFDTIIPLAREFEEKLIKLVWQNRVAFSAPNSTTQTPADTSSDVRLNEKGDPSVPELTVRDHVPKQSRWSFGWKLSSKGPTVPKDQDPEKGVSEYALRRMRMFAPFYNGFGCALSICRPCPQFSFILHVHHFPVFIGSGVNIMLQEFVLDPTYNRFGLLITAPFLMCVSIVSGLPDPSVFLFSPESVLLLASRCQHLLPVSRARMLTEAYSPRIGLGQLPSFMRTRHITLR